jgi:NAD(P)-dependent dehydrogenase (short-subunit alcohol dehydrogenase family)
MLEEFRLDGEVAIVLGQKADSLTEFASALAEAGASVVVAGRRKNVLDCAIEQVTKRGARALSVVIDPLSDRDVEDMLRTTITAFERVDVLVNDYATPFGKPFVEMKHDEWDKSMEQNLTTVSISSRIIGHYLRGQKKGTIVNVISGLAERGLPNGVAYCAGMGAVSQLSRALGLEWARDNVRVNAIGAGWMEDEDSRQTDDLIARYIPMGRRCRPGDVSPLVVFLASSASSYLTGYTLYVDGGLIARG